MLASAVGRVGSDDSVQQGQTVGCGKDAGDGKGAQKWRGRAVGCSGTRRRCRAERRAREGALGSRAAQEKV